MSLSTINDQSVVGQEYILSNIDGVLITIEANHEEQSVGNAFKDCEFSRQKIQGMQRSLDNGTAIHVFIKITVNVNGKTGDSYLGSCWDKDLYTMVKSDLHGYLPQMIEEATQEANG